MRPRRALHAALGGVLLALVGAQAAAAVVHAGGSDGGGRLLVVSMPGLTWSEVERHDLPALDGLLAGSAMADLAPRGVLARSGPGDAYLTISAGARATTSRAVDGQVLALEEQSSGSEAGEIFRRRTGVVPDGDYVVLSWPALVRANDGEPYDAELGLLAETLEDHGVVTSVIGNADGTDAIGPSYERQVGLALADADGVVARGALDAGPPRRRSVLALRRPLRQRGGRRALPGRLARCGRRRGRARRPRRGRDLRPRPVVALPAAGRRGPLPGAASQGARGERRAARRAARRGRPRARHGPGGRALQPRRRPRPHGGRPPAPARRRGVPHLGVDPARRVPDAGRHRPDHPRHVGDRAAGGDGGAPGGDRRDARCPTTRASSTSSA